MKQGIRHNAIPVKHSFRVMLSTVAPVRIPSPPCFVTEASTRRQIRGAVGGWTPTLPLFHSTSVYDALPQELNAILTSATSVAERPDLMYFAPAAGVIGGCSSPFPLARSAFPSYPAKVGKATIFIGTSSLPWICGEFHVLKICLDDWRPCVRVLVCRHGRCNAAFETFRLENTDDSCIVRPRALCTLLLWDSPVCLDCYFLFFYVCLRARACALSWPLVSHCASPDARGARSFAAVSNASTQIQPRSTCIPTYHSTQNSVS